MKVSDPIKDGTLHVKRQTRKLKRMAKTTEKFDVVLEVSKVMEEYRIAVSKIAPPDLLTGLKVIQIVDTTLDRLRHELLQTGEWSKAQTERYLTDIRTEAKKASGNLRKKLRKICDQFIANKKGTIVSGANGGILEAYVEVIKHQIALDRLRKEAIPAALEKDQETIVKEMERLLWAQNHK